MQSTLLEFKVIAPCPIATGLGKKSPCFLYKYPEDNKYEAKMHCAV